MCITMLSDFKQLIQSLDGYTYTSIVMRESEIDRLHFLALRLLKSEIRRLYKPEGLLEYRTIVRALESISDHCTKMSDSLMKIKHSIPQLVELVERCESILKMTMNAVHKEFRAC